MHFRVRVCVCVYRNCCRAINYFIIIKHDYYFKICLIYHYSVCRHYILKTIQSKTLKTKTKQKCFINVPTAGLKAIN